MPSGSIHTDLLIYKDHGLSPPEVTALASKTSLTFLVNMAFTKHHALAASLLVSQIAGQSGFATSDRSDDAFSFVCLHCLSSMREIY